MYGDQEGDSPIMYLIVGSTLDSTCAYYMYTIKKREPV